MNHTKAVIIKSIVRLLFTIHSYTQNRRFFTHLSGFFLFEPRKKHTYKRRNLIDGCLKWMGSLWTNCTVFFFFYGMTVLPCFAFNQRFISSWVWITNNFPTNDSNKLRAFFPCLASKTLFHLDFPWIWTVFDIEFLNSDAIRSRFWSNKHVNNQQSKCMIRIQKYHNFSDVFFSLCFKLNEKFFENQLTVSVNLQLSM